MALLVLFVPLIVLSVALGRAYSEVDEEFVHDWADAHALTLTTANRPLVWWYLRNARVLRTWGVLAALVLPPLGSLASGKDLNDGVGTSLVWIFAGHLIGALYAEVALRRPSPEATRVASLTRREVAQYLPARLRHAPAVVTVLVAAAAVIAWTGTAHPVDRASVLVTTAVAPLIALAVGAMQRWIVRRPQPFVAPDLVAADDAIRSQSVHLLAGSGTAMLLSLLGANCYSAGWSHEGPIVGILSAVGILTFPLAIVSCLYYGHRAWRVRRTPFLGDPVASA